MTGRDRRQTRGLITSRQMSQDARKQAVPKPITNRVWDQPEPQRAAQHATIIDNRPLTVEFTALRLLEAVVRKEGAIALSSMFTVDDCVNAARRLITRSGEK